MKRIERNSKINNMNLIIFWMTISLCSCSNPICDETIRFIDKKCSQANECKIDLKEVYDFRWDYLYIFDALLYPDEISNTIGFDCHCDIVKDDHKLVLFVVDNKIIRNELMSCFNLEFPSENGVSIVNKDSTLFNVTFKTYGGERNFILSKITE